MPDDKIVRSIIERCDFLYGDSVLSKETIIEQYLAFIARQFNPVERSVCFAFHTGSVCFDIVTIAALVIGCLAYEYSSNDEILSELEDGDLVLFKGERYHWGGIETIDESGPRIVIWQDPKGKNGILIRRISYNLNKHLIKPYYGTASATDGRGVRKDKTNRNDFISYILGIPVDEVPVSLDLSAVIVADKSRILDILKNLVIRYNNNKIVSITDIVPVSYYTSSGEQLQIGKNVSKAEPVLKVTSKISMARDLVLDKQGNHVVGLLVTNGDLLASNTSELNDLLRRKSLKFAYVLAPFNGNSCEAIIDQYETAKFFACTKEVLSEQKNTIVEDNKLTEELNKQISNILARKTQVTTVENDWDWSRYKYLKEKLYIVKQSSWSGEDRDSFILSAMALINLFCTSFFSMERMENAIANGEINHLVVSPEKRIAELFEIANKSFSMKEQCSEIAEMLLEMYSSVYDYSPKEAALRHFLEENNEKRIALIVPKAYYSELFAAMFQEDSENVICVTANRFDNSDQYDIILTTGDYIGKRFDPIQCFSAPQISLLLYSFEEKIFSFRKRKSMKSEKKLNAKIKGLVGDDYKKAVEAYDSSDSGISDSTIQEFSDLESFIDAMGMFDVRKLTTTNSPGEYSNTAEVKYVGTFITGEQILFSKYYSAVVFDQNKGEITETSPEKLLPGDILVFTKKNDYTRNIVDNIFEQLIMARKLNAEVQDAAEKAFYWKAALREYKEENHLTYNDIASELKKQGSSLNVVTIRQWLIEESHIIGPRDVETMRYIALVTQDPYLLNDPEGYFEACRVIRHYRREILSLIAQAINDKLSNKESAQGTIFEVIYENVDKLSETMELENIYELDDVAIINNGMVNRPINESEVLL